MMYYAIIEKDIELNTKPIIYCTSDVKANAYMICELLNMKEKHEWDLLVDIYPQTKKFKPLYYEVKEIIDDN